jgi:Tfp pilus assembly protein PilF
MNIENQFIKALMYLDRNKTNIAKNILEKTLEITRQENNQLYYIKINTVLGELYFNEENNIKAKEYLLEALNTKYEEDDVLNYEKEKCKELLNKINNKK